MRIVCTVTNDLSYDQRMIRICSTLAEAGHEVLLLGRMKPDSVRLKRRPFRQKRLRCWFHKGKLFYLEYNIRLFLFLLLHPFDVLNAVDLDTLLPGYCVSRLRSKPLVYDAHEYFTQQLEVVSRFRVWRIWKGLENYLLPKVRHAYTVCDSLAKVFQEEYGMRAEVVRNVPFQKPLPPKPPAYGGLRKVILYQGSLNEGRGLEAMISTMPRLPIEAELWLAGEGDLSTQLRQQVFDMGLSHRVKFLGYLQPEALADITPKAYVGINLLNNTGLSYYYSLANKTFDYIQALVPCVHMDFPEYQAIMEAHEVGLLIPDLKIETLTLNLRKLIEDEPLHRRLSENCRKAREEYVWEKESDKLLAVYARFSPGG